MAIKKKAKSSKKRKVVKRPLDTKSIHKKVNQFVDHLGNGVNSINPVTPEIRDILREVLPTKVFKEFSLKNNICKMVLWSKFHDCLYNSHTIWFIHKHFTEIETNKDYRDSVKWSDEDELFDYQTIPIVKGRIDDGMRELINSGGIAKFNKILLEQFKVIDGRNN